MTAICAKCHEPHNRGNAKRKQAYCCKCHAIFERERRHKKQQEIIKVLEECEKKRISGSEGLKKLMQIIAPRTDVRWNSHTGD